MLKREFTSTPFKHRDDQDLLTALRSHLDTQSDRVFVKCAIYMDFMPGRPAQFESLMSGDVVKEVSGQLHASMASKTFRGR